MSRLSTLLLITGILTVVSTANAQQPYPSSSNETTTTINSPSPHLGCPSTLRHTCLADCLTLNPPLSIQSFPDSCYLSNRNRLECAKVCGFTKIDIMDCEDRMLRREEVMVDRYFIGGKPLWEVGLGDGKVGNVGMGGRERGRDGDGGAGEVRIEVGLGERDGEGRENEEGSESGKQGERH